MGVRRVRVERERSRVYRARNDRGGEIEVSSDGGAAFTPVELLLTAVATCSAVDVDVVTGRRSEPTRFEVLAEAEKVRDDGGNVLRDIRITFAVAFPEGEAGDGARAVLPRALQVSHDRTCTVSRTVEAGTPVSVRIGQMDQSPADSVDPPSAGRR